jgi:hypothetical protein
MKQIKLNRNRFAIVDNDDFEYLQWFSWTIDRNHYGYFYASRSVMTDGISKREKMHRVIMKVTDPNIFVDHINGNGLDNRKSNLRLCNRSQNAANKHRIRGKSQYLGVYKVVQYGISYWKAVCKKDKKTIQQYHHLEGEAALAYNEMAKHFHGEFANLNTLTKKHLDEIEEHKNKKRCGKCKLYKTKDNFNKSSCTSTGLSSYCKGCLKLQWKNVDKIKIRESNKKACKKYREKKKKTP